MLTLALILFPLAIALLLIPVRHEADARKIALTGALAEAGLAVAAFITYRYGCPCHLGYSINWFAEPGMGLRFGLDGISLLMVMLTAILVPVIVASAFSRSRTSPGAFFSLVMLMEAALVGVFASSNGLVFYIFWELALIPAWFICALWGGHDRIRITFKFFVYTFAGSLLMLVAILWLWFRTPVPHSFDIRWLSQARISTAEQAWIFAAFFLAFAIKIPVFPFHTWQPDTYTTAPAQGSMLLAGIMLKMGLFGMIRWMIPLAPEAVQQHAPLVIGLAVAGIVYASVIALRQDDMKRLIAWSSIAHVGLIAAGIFTLTPYGLQGAVIQMVSHGINITGLFIVTDLIEKRSGTRSLALLGGIARKAPRLAAVFMILLLGSVALPLTNGFVGEFLLLAGLFKYSVTASAVAGLTIILGAVYMLRMYQKAMLGEPAGATLEFADLSWKETTLFVPLIILVFWIGIAPGFFLDLSLPDIMELLTMTG